MLYEIVYQKYFTEEGQQGEERTHQIPANSEWDACATLGQIFSGEDYELRILEVKRVR